MQGYRKGALETGRLLREKAGRKTHQCRIAPLGAGVREGVGEGPRANPQN